MKRNDAHGILVGLCLLLVGCVPFLRQAKEPMDKVWLTDRSDAGCVVVLLPGRFGSPEDFAKAGFADAVVERGLDIELLAVDAHLGYYRDRSIVKRLQEDVMASLLAEDRQIWLAGVSLGGLGSLIYTRAHPEQLSGAVLLAPFLGDDDLVEQIEAAGGPGAWQRPEGLGTDTIEGLWQWVGTDFVDGPPISIRLGFGGRDRLAAGNRLFAELLAADHVLTVDGGHDWSVWTELWGEMLERGLVCGSS